MDIEALGVGRLGGTLAQLPVESDREVAMASGSGVESFEDLLETLGPQLRPMEPKQAVRFGDMVFLAIPSRGCDSLPDTARSTEKIVVDAVNPRTGSFHVIDFGDDTSSEFVASQLPGARLVRLFSTIHWETLRDLSRPGLPRSERLVAFLTDDGSDTKTCIVSLIRGIGFGPVNVGDFVSDDELLEPGSTLYKREIMVEGAQDAIQTLRARQG